jgi:ribA/ribD-fused uncharacterized protein
MIMETTNGFRNEYFFLSNFETSPITATVRGVEATFPSGEHLFQAYKLEHSTISDNSAAIMVNQFANAPTPSKAKYLGRSVPLNIEAWNNHSYEFMQRTVEAKFLQHPTLARQLKETEDIDLVEYNSWGDTLWGKDEKTRLGKNQLGEILMALRKELLKSEPKLF